MGTADARYAPYLRSTSPRTVWVPGLPAGGEVAVREQELQIVIDRRRSFAERSLNGLGQEIHGEASLEREIPAINLLSKWTYKRPWWCSG